MLYVYVPRHVTTYYMVRTLVYNLGTSTSIEEDELQLEDTGLLSYRRLVGTCLIRILVIGSDFPETCVGWRIASK